MLIMNDNVAIKL